MLPQKRSGVPRRGTTGTGSRAHSRSRTSLNRSWHTREPGVHSLLSLKTPAQHEPNNTTTQVKNNQSNPHRGLAAAVPALALIAFGAVPLNAASSPIDQMAMQEREQDGLELYEKVFGQPAPAEYSPEEAYDAAELESERRMSTPAFRAGYRPSRDA